MNANEPDPRHADEWRGEVTLEADEHGRSLGKRLRTLDLDDEARKRLGGSVIVTRDGGRMYLYAWHEQSAREAERVTRELLEEEGVTAEVSLTRWHPVEETWKPASEALPESPDQAELEAEKRRRAELEEAAQGGGHGWEVMVELPSLHATVEFARELENRGLPVKRRFRYLLIGAATEEAAEKLRGELSSEAPEGSRIGVRVNPDEFELPVFVQLGSHKPGVLRDLGL